MEGCSAAQSVKLHRETKSAAIDRRLPRCTREEAGDERRKEHWKERKKERKTPQGERGRVGGKTTM